MSVVKHVACTRTLQMDTQFVVEKSDGKRPLGKKMNVDGQVIFRLTLTK